MTIADAQTAARVKTALVNDPDLGTRVIEVRVVLGVARLSGRVLTRAEADRAVGIARSVAGVVDVQSTLQIGGEAIVPPDDQVQRFDLQELDAPEIQGDPRLLALGAAVGWTDPRAAALKQRVTVSPLIRFGSGRGLGLAVGLNWFQAELQSAGRSDVLTRVQIRPIMLGAGYTIASERTSLSASLVGGYAWNSLTVTGTGAADGLAVEVDNSLVWRPGASLWYDVNRRTALNFSIGYVVTRLQLTVLEGGQLEKRSERGDTTIVRAGIAYKLF
jgi:hypothetical protein